MSESPSTSKHTPGPWHRNIAPASKYTVIFAGRNNHVARIDTVSKTEEEMEGNCNLIAAAPELLEALKGLLGAWPGHPLDLETLALHNAARAIIANAEGRGVSNV